MPQILEVTIDLLFFALEVFPQLGQVGHPLVLQEVVVAGEPPTNFIALGLGDEIEVLY